MIRRANFFDRLSLQKLGIKTSDFERISTRIKTKVNSKIELTRFEKKFLKLYWKALVPHLSKEWIDLFLELNPIIDDTKYLNSCYDKIINILLQEQDLIRLKVLSNKYPIIKSRLLYYYLNSINFTPLYRLGLCSTSTRIFGDKEKDLKEVISYNSSYIVQNYAEDLEAKIMPQRLFNLFVSGRLPYNFYIKAKEKKSLEELKNWLNEISEDELSVLNNRSINKEELRSLFDKAPNYAEDLEAKIMPLRLYNLFVSGRLPYNFYIKAKEKKSLEELKNWLNEISEDELSVLNDRSISKKQLRDLIDEVVLEEIYYTVCKSPGVIVKYSSEMHPALTKFGKDLITGLCQKEASVNDANKALNEIVSQHQNDSVFCDNIYLSNQNLANIFETHNKNQNYVDLLLDLLKNYTNIWSVCNSSRTIVIGDEGEKASVRINSKYAPVGYSGGVLHVPKVTTLDELAKAAGDLELAEKKLKDANKYRQNHSLQNNNIQNNSPLRIYRGPGDYEIMPDVFPNGRESKKSRLSRFKKWKQEAEIIDDKQTSEISAENQGYELLEFICENCANLWAACQTNGVIVIGERNDLNFEASNDASFGYKGGTLYLPSIQLTEELKQGLEKLDEKVPKQLDSPKSRSILIYDVHSKESRTYYYGGLVQSNGRSK